MPPHATRALAAAVLALALPACAIDDDANLLRLYDVNPRHVELGDRVEVVGHGFPAGRDATVVLRGSWMSPGEAREASRSIPSIPARAVSEDVIEFRFTQGLLEAIGGRSTFRGDVQVRFDSEGQARPVTGTLRAVQLDFDPPTARRLAVEIGSEGRALDVLAFLGVRTMRSPAQDSEWCERWGPHSDRSGAILEGRPYSSACAGEEAGQQPREPAHPIAGGLRVYEVVEGSPADAADLRAGDLLTEMDGRAISTVSDFIPRADLRQVQLAITRDGDETPVTATVSLRGFGAAPPAELVGAGVLLVVAFIVIMLFMAPTAGITTWVERRVAGRMQSRIGPNRAGPNGFLQWMADGIKSITKEDIIPTNADEPLFRLAPYLVFIGVTATFVVMPFSRSWIAADLDVGMLYIIAVTSLVTIGIMTGGWASNNKWSLLGGIRSAAQIISYEVPAAVAVVCIVMLSGTLRLQGIVEAQGGWPWQWWVFKNPIAFLLFPLYFTAALAEGNRAPFDLPEAESELVAGYSTEYSGMRYLFFFFAEWANVFVMSGIASALFLGGWQLPGVDPSTLETGWYWQLLGAVLFVSKSWVLIFVVIWVRWTLPRVRIDQMMNMCWKWFVPLTFVGFLLTALWLVLQLPHIVELITGIILSVVGLLCLLWFAGRVRSNLKSARVGTGGMQAFHVNPFI